MSKNKDKLILGESEVKLPIADGGIKGGFASPAQDYIESGIDLNKELIRNPASTFLGKVVGDSMVGAGLEEGDIIVIDKSLQAKEGDIVVCALYGEFTLKRIHFERDFIWLVPENKRYKIVKVSKEDEFLIWGVVTYSIKDIQKKNQR